ncbi:competence protein ComK [Lentibacillus persicus]|uniref:Competence protein ComK n=1 Tax=Lentibacillus persicus TaxID=640948 RepID=A0A1I1XT01_9BACI|nr:competence protein ComK [Lentibacillus persicus]SFE10446.1 competence protein ComK [Lentibacillus persicus]
MKENSTGVYIISRKTKAIMKKDSTYFRSRILESGKEIESVYSPEQIIDHSCLLYGSTLDGRRKSAQKILKLHSKVPLSVVPDKGVYMLPTNASRSKENVWLSYYHIKEFEQHDNRTYVTFQDGSGMYVSTSETSLNKQSERTGALIAKLNRSFIFGSSPFFPDNLN